MTEFSYADLYCCYSTMENLDPMLHHAESCQFNGVTYIISTDSWCNSFYFWKITEENREFLATLERTNNIYDFVTPLWNIQGTTLPNQFYVNYPDICVWNDKMCIIGSRCYIETDGTDTVPSIGLDFRTAYPDHYDGDWDWALSYSSLVVFNNKIYTNGGGNHVFVYDGNTWELASDYFYNTGVIGKRVQHVCQLVVFNNELYCFTIYSTVPDHFRWSDDSLRTELWKFQGGTSWTKVFDYTNFNKIIARMVVKDNLLYILCCPFATSIYGQLGGNCYTYGSELLTLDTDGNLVTRYITTEGTTGDNYVDFNFDVDTNKLYIIGDYSDGDTWYQQPRVWEVETFTPVVVFDETNYQYAEGIGPTDLYFGIGSLIIDGSNWIVTFGNDWYGWPECDYGDWAMQMLPTIAPSSEPSGEEPPAPSGEEPPAPSGEPEPEELSIYLRHYWQFLVDLEGNCKPGQRINVYLAGTNEYARLRLTEDGPVVTTENNELLTNYYGFFDFWIGNINRDEEGYPYTQRFKITWTKDGVTGGVDNVEILCPWGDWITRWPDLEDKPSSLVTFSEDITGSGLMNEMDSVVIPITITRDILGDLTSDNTLSTTLTVPASSIATFEVSSFCNRCIAYQISVEKSVKTGSVFAMAFYKDNTFAGNKIQYQVDNVSDSAIWTDKAMIHLKDDLGNSKLYTKIFNLGPSGAFDLTINYEKFG